jgi:hypothetical protein
MENKKGFATKKLTKKQERALKTYICSVHNIMLERALPKRDELAPVSRAMKRLERGAPRYRRFELRGGGHNGYD